MYLDRRKNPASRTGARAGRRGSEPQWLWNRWPSDGYFEVKQGSRPPGHLGWQKSSRVSSWKLFACSRKRIETTPFPGPSAVICMADSPEQLAVIQDEANVAARLDLIFNDASEAYQAVRPPTIEDARKILRFVDEHSHLPCLIIQCEVGVGRSQAVLAALFKMHNLDYKKVLAHGTYNRSLYRQLLAAANLPPEPEPLVSIAVRVKYAPDRLHLFMLSMLRQRYDNWEIVAVTDGPNEAAARLVLEIKDPRIRLIETEKSLGRWGHPYRQLGLDACRGAFIGMSNDDNYYVPGYLEQMMNALENADLAMCQMLHSYGAWEVAPAGSDLGSWIARASLVRQVPWTGRDFTSDQDYIAITHESGERSRGKTARPLFIHN